MHLLTEDGKISTLLTLNPSAPTTPVTVTGLTAGESLVAIDVRPQNQLLYGLGVNSTTDTATLYIVNPTTGFASVVGTASQIAFTSNGVLATDFPDPLTVKWDIDFNPAVDRLRVVAGSLNFRINPNTGAGVDGDNGGAVTTGTNPDGAINGATTTVGAAAYTNNVPNNGNIATLYTINDTTNSLYIQSNPNSGTQTLVAGITLSAVALDVSRSSFDIAPGVNAPASNTAVASGIGYLVSNTGGVSSKLYSINLVTAAATLLGDTGLIVRSSALVPNTGAALTLTADGANLVRFNPATPTTTTTVAVGVVSLTPGETLVALSSRPQTGQLYGLGINATANTGSLYLVDPQTGGLTLVGAASGIAYVNASAVAIDFPDPATSGYGMDFNPTLDRLRVVTGTGLNFRINPTTGVPIDGDLNGAAVAGTNPDAPLSLTGIRSAGYTNSYAQSITGPATTLYTLGSTTGSLYIQNPLNAGTQTNALPVTLGGPALTISPIGGFDIPHSVAVAASNTAATGQGWLTSQVAATTGLYRIDLATGQATSIGNIGAGATAIRSLVLWAAQADLSVENPTGTVVADNLSTANFATAVNVPVTKTITLRNLGSEPLTYYTTFTTGLAFSATGNPAGTIPGDSSVVVTVTFLPTVPGIQGDTLHIISNDAEIAAFEVNLSGNGLIPQTNDTLNATDGPTRLNPLANDTLPGTLYISSVSDPLIQIENGRTLIIPDGYTGQFTYTVNQDGTDTGTATVTVVPTSAASGPRGYNGVLTDVTGKVIGWGQARLSKKGAGTIRIVTTGSNTSTRVTFPTGSPTVNVATPAGLLMLDRSSSGVIDFSLNGGAVTGTLHSEVPRTNDTGTYHIGLRSVDLATYPGYGYATAAVTGGGTTNLRGLLPDGNSFTASTSLTDNKAIAFYTSNLPSVNPSGGFGGDLTLWANPTTDVTGELVWNKPPQAPNAGGTHLGGVDTVLLANGSLFNRTGLYPSGVGTMELAGGNLLADENTLPVVNNGVPVIPPGSLLSWSISRGNGTFSFTVFDPVLGKSVRGTGLYLQKSDQAVGYFPGSTTGGRVVLDVNTFVLPPP